MADGPRHPDRGGARRDARGRPASALFGGYTEGPLDAFGEASDRQAVATGTTRCTGQAIGARGRALRLGAKPRPCRQRAGDAAAAVEAVVDAAETALDDGARARGAADETRRRARSVPHRLAPGHDRDLRRQRNVQLSARSRQTAADTIARRSLSVRQLYLPFPALHQTGKLAGEPTAGHRIELDAHLSSQ